MLGCVIQIVTIWIGNGILMLLVALGLFLTFVCAYFSPFTLFLCNCVHCLGLCGVRRKVSRSHQAEIQHAFWNNGNVSG